MGAFCGCALLTEVLWLFFAGNIAASGVPAIASEHAEQEKLYKHLDYYEVLRDSNIVGHTTASSRHKRDNHGLHRPDHSGITEIEFSTLNRHFHLYLTHDTSVFAEGFEAMSADADGKPRRIPVTVEGFYSGHVSGETFSKVTVRWEDELLVAKIETSNETFYVEPMKRHVPTADNHTMLSYRRSDWKSLPSSQMHTHGSFCGWRGNDAKRSVSRNKFAPVNNASKVSQRVKKRSAPARNTCALLVIADYLFYKTIANSSETWAANYMIDMVNRVDKIYRETKFSTEWTNLGFAIKKILVHTSWSEDSNHYNAQRKWSPDELLDALANHTAHQVHFEDYCLVHLFTANSGFNGVLGLAYIAESPFESGICAYYRMPPEPDQSLFFSNTGFSTLISRGNRRLLDSQAETLLAHELGHNWGSVHDPISPECYPLEDGRFIMDEYESQHNDPNRKLFSPCSRRHIATALSFFAERCFEVARDTLRGNYRIDEGEECDAGVAGDTCCGENFMLNNGPSSCSDANNVCCTNCSIKAANNNVCRHSSILDCRAETSCNGIEATCPVAYRAIGTSCLPNSFGRCSPKTSIADEGDVYCAPLCEVVGLKSCMCRDVAHRCHLCCQRGPGDKCAVFTYANYTAIVQQCADDKSRHCRKNGMYPSFEPYHWTNIMSFPQDTPCVIGFCNSEGVCQKQLQDKLANFLSFLSNLTPDEAVKFMKDNIVGTIVTFAFILWFPMVLLIVRADNRWSRLHSSELLHNDELSPLVGYMNNPVLLYKGKPACGGRQQGSPSLRGPTGEQQLRYERKVITSNVQGRPYAGVTFAF